MIVGSTVITALLALTLPATAAAVSPTAGGRNDAFNGDSCTGRTFCVAVGNYSLNGHKHGLSEILRGTHWVAEPVPRPAHKSNIFANEVSCASPARCLFVGTHFGGPRSLDVNLAEAWNGSSWRIVTATGPPGTAFSVLNDVACPTTTFCLAVGQAGSARRSQDTAYTWTNGTTWRRITVPHPARARTSELGALACFNAKNCMAVGNYTTASGRDLAFAARRHDGRWKLMATPAIRGQLSTTFDGISCPAAIRCVAVGTAEDNTRGRFFHAFAEVWSRGRWRVSTLRRRPSSFIGVSCPSRNRCFASGSTFPSASGFAHPLIETWNGGTWRTQRTVETAAPHAGDVLPHVSCVTRSRCEAVGFRFRPGRSGSDRTLAEKWNGHRWALQVTANP